MNERKHGETVKQFPFGQELRKVEQQDRTPKEFFVLGVYASAVHAKWVNTAGKVVCRSLAVASEPYIFWKNDNDNEAERIINNIMIPPELGKLLPAAGIYNGPSGRALDEHILKPLGTDRKNTWLCDLMPEARMNKSQQKIHKEKYHPLVMKYQCLNNVTVEPVQSCFCDEKRRDEITLEIKESRAKYLVLLGDIPIKQYLKKVVPGIDFSSLCEYNKKYEYGAKYRATINYFDIDVIPLAHPRQVAKIGNFTKHWFHKHKKWEGDCSTSRIALRC